MPINSASIPALRVARAVKRRKRAEGGGIFDYSGVGEAMPEAYGAPETPKTIRRLTGTQPGEPRYQLWPEKMVRSGATLAGDVLSGRQAVLPPGLRREDYTDVPAPFGPTEDSTWLGGKMGWAPQAAQPNDPMMERAQDMAGLAGGQTLVTGARGAVPAAERALVAAADSQATGAPLAALEHTKTPQFKEWFGTSKGVDAEGKPERFYHGTTSDFDTFGPIGGGNQYGEGYYFTKSPESASNYATGDVNRISPHGNAHPNVMPVYLKYEKPYDRRGPVSPVDLRKLEAAANEIEPGKWKKGELARQFERVYPANGDNVAYQLGPQAEKIIRNAGFDAFVAPDMTVVFDPAQIKSATGNSGTFSPRNQSALFEDSAATGAPVSALENDGDLVASLLAEQEARTKPKKSAIPMPERKAGGSVASPAMEVARHIKRAKGGKVHIGPIVGDTGGRADKVPMRVPNGAYVVPADIVSGLGEGNSGAGMLKLGQMFPESKPSLMRAMPSKDPVPVLCADGEFVVSPTSITKRWDDIDYGHRTLDAWVLHERKNLIATLKDLPGPAQD